MAWIVLSEAELDAGDTRAGEAAARRALALQPRHPEALARLGRSQWMQGRFTDAATSLRAAVSAAPNHAGLWVWLAHVLEDTGEAEAAAAAYERAYALAPGEPQIAAYLLAWRRRLCDWREVDALSSQVRAAVASGAVVIEPFAFLSEDATAAEQLRCARLRAAAMGKPPNVFPHGALSKRGAGLRVGFLSNGFGAHPTGLLTVAMFEAMARAHHDIDVHLFAIGPDDGSGIRRRLADATTLHDVSGFDHVRVARSIQASAINVLFDLRGWGGGGMPEVLAMRPARVQVNWLAYPGTSGAPWIDFVLADGFVLPAELEPTFSERVVRLPRCFQPSDTTRRLPAPASRDAYGLPERGNVYCCFNNGYKLNPRSMGRAFAVLAQVPGSVLWLLSTPGDGDARLRQAASDAGIDPERLVFMPKQPQAEYLARLQHADLFLDTTPYNAHTTASDAIWAGCPVLTTPGGTFASRVAGSLNHHLGMDELNLGDDDAFIETAVRFGRDNDALRDLRNTLHCRRDDSGLFDMEAYAADFANAIRRMASIAP